jgi:predicted nuclease of predicted toxin-antitoxin system
VKLLLDQNLSYKLVDRLSDVFPGSSHVREVGLGSASDEVVWSHARENGFVLVSKDEDFHQMSFVLGPPPQVVWVQLGNCRTAEVEECIRENRVVIEEFEAEKQAAFLIIGRRMVIERA